MVRNAASMQNLRASISDHNFSAPHPQREYTMSTLPNPNASVRLPEAALPQRLRPTSLQVRGDDAHTKALMNRVATGQATLEEQAAFEEHIKDVRRLEEQSRFQPYHEEKKGYEPEQQSTYTPYYEERKGHQATKQDYDYEQFFGPRDVPSRTSSSKNPTAASGDANLDALRFPKATRSNAALYAQPFCEFLTNNPTVFHAVASQKKQLTQMGWTELDERETWDIKPSGRYFVDRNGSALIAFVVGENYEPGNGCAILAGHVDALTAKLKPISEVPNKAGYSQLGVAPYAGGMNNTWWDRDLGIAGRVLVKQGDKIVSRLVDLNWPIARIPTLAPHFGEAAMGPFNKETQMVPIVGLEGVDASASPIQADDAFSHPPLLGGEKGPVGSFIQTQPKGLVKAVQKALGLESSSAGTIINWELELYDVQPATVGGLNKEFIYGGRIDDKLCSWAAMQALMGSQLYDTRFSSIIKVVGWFDDEEIGSKLRQGAQSNFLPSIIERAVGSLSKHRPESDLLGRTYANSYLLSSDVTHAVNPNFLNAYLPSHAPHLNTGLCVAADSNGHMTTDSVSTAILQRCAERIGAKLQVFQIRNDSRSGGTVGPMLSSMTGIRAIDAGLPQLSMHSIRATTGSLDPGLGVLMFTGFLNGFERVDEEFKV